jgi:hypothetical protein
MKTAAWGFSNDNDVKAFLGQFSALLVRPAPGHGADRRVAGQSWFVPLRSALFAEFESRGVVFIVSDLFVIFVIVAVFAVSMVGVFDVSILW